MLQAFSHASFWSIAALGDSWFILSLRFDGGALRAGAA
jgi:hypothetical protein